MTRYDRNTRNVNRTPTISGRKRLGSKTRIHDGSVGTSGIEMACDVGRIDMADFAVIGD